MSSPDILSGTPQSEEPSIEEALHDAAEEVMTLNLRPLYKRTPSYIVHVVGLHGKALARATEANLILLDGPSSNGNGVTNR